MLYRFNAAPLQQDHFGEFQLNIFRLDVPFIKTTTDVLDDLRSSKLNRRDVHGNGGRQDAQLLPRLSLPACVVKNPFAESDDETRLFRHWNKFLRRYNSTFWFVPTYKGLKPYDFPRGQFYLGLVVKRDLALPNCTE